SFRVWDGHRRLLSGDYHIPIAVSEPVPALLPRRVVSACHAEHPARGNLLLPRMDSAAGTLCTRGVRTCLAKIVGRQFNSPPCLETLMRPALLLLGLSLLLPLGCHRSAPTKELTESPTVAPAPSSGVYDPPRLSADLRASSPARRQMAIEKAAALNAQGEDVVPILLEALKDPTAGELGGTRIAVATSTREAAVLALLNLKAKGTKALTEIGLKTLENGLKDAKPNVREHTANAIGMVGPDAKSSAPAVIPLCMDKDPHVRSAAYSAVERIKTVPAEPILKMLVHPDVAVAEDAASALEWLNPTGSTAIPLLLDALKREPREKDDPVAVSHIRSAAAEALAGVGKGSETAVPALVDAILKARPEDVERMTRPVKATDTAANMSGPVMALRRIGAPAVAAVTPLLKNEQAIVRYQAAAVFSGIGPAGFTALPEVQTALEAERGLPTGQMYVFEELVAA